MKGERLKKILTYPPNILEKIGTSFDLSSTILALYSSDRIYESNEFARTLMKNFGTVPGGIIFEFINFVVYILPLLLSTFGSSTIGKILEKSSLNDKYKKAGKLFSSLSELGLWVTLAIYGGRKYAAGAGNITNAAINRFYGSNIPAKVANEASNLMQKLSTTLYSGITYVWYKPKLKEYLGKIKGIFNRSDYSQNLYKSMC